MTEWFEAPVKKLITLSREEAKRLDSCRLGPEHLFLGLLRLENDSAIDLVKMRTGETGLDNLKKAIEERVRVSYDHPFPDGNIVLSVQAEMILKSTKTEMLNASAKLVSTSHVLLALLNPKLNRGMAFIEIFKKYKITYDVIFSSLPKEPTS